MKQIYKSIVLYLAAVLGTITLSAQSPCPFIDAMRLHGDVSCMKVYHQYWKTEFGEKVETKKVLEGTSYYDKDHRLLHVTFRERNYNIYFEYEYDNAGKLVTVDCYEHDTYRPATSKLEYKIKLQEENGTTVGYLYDNDGTEEAIFHPYNAILPFAGYAKPYPGYGYGDVFAFDIISAPASRLDPFARIDYNNYAPMYRYEYNSNRQPIIIKTGAEIVNLNYDNAANLIRMEITEGIRSNNKSGEIFTIEYVYGDFEESEKYRRATVLARLEREKAQQDSIARAERIAKELKEKEEEERKVYLRKLQGILKEIASPLYTDMSYILFNVKKSIKEIYPVQNGLQIVLKKTGQTSDYVITDCIEYSDGRTYAVYCNDDLTRLIISMDKTIYFIEPGDESSQKIYSVPANFKNIVEEYLSGFSPSDKIGLMTIM